MINESTAVKPLRFHAQVRLQFSFRYTVTRTLQIGMLIVMLTVACACAGSVAAPAPSAPEPPGQKPFSEPSSDQLREQVAICRADSGECQASMPCTGTAEGRVCDESKCITADAAVRVARTNGLPEGLDGPKASFVYNYDYRRLIWSVENLQYDRSRPGSPASGSADRGGDVFIVDAVTGELLAKQLWGVKH